MRNFSRYARDIIVRDDALSAPPLSPGSPRGGYNRIVRQLESYEHARKRWLASEDKRQPVGGTSRGRVPSDSSKATEKLESYKHARKRRLASEDKRQSVGVVRRQVGHLPEKIPKNAYERRTSSAGPMDGAARQAVAIR